MIWPHCCVLENSRLPPRGVYPKLPFLIYYYYYFIIIIIIIFKALRLVAVVFMCFFLIWPPPRDLSIARMFYFVAKYGWSSFCTRLDSLKTLITEIIQNPFEDYSFQLIYSKLLIRF